MSIWRDRDRFRTSGREERLNERQERDFGALEREIVFLRNQLQKAQSNAGIIKSIYSETQKENREIKEQLGNLESLLKNMIHSLVSYELAKARLNDPEVSNWSVEKLCEFAIDVVKRREYDLRQTVNMLQSEEVRLKRLNEELTKNLYQLQNNRLNANLLHLENENGEREKSDDSAGGSEREEFNDNEKRLKQVASDLLVVEHVKDLSERLTNEHRVLIDIIGTEGIFRTTELRTHPRFLEVFNANSHYYSQKLKDLVQLGFLSQENIRTGTRGHTYDVYMLSDKGKSIFQSLFGRQPVESQLTSLLKRHATPEHAIFVLDTRQAFESLGWEVDDSLRGNRVDLPESGQRVVFDLTIKKGGEVRRIECERGMQSPDDIFAKLDKWLRVVPKFWYVSPNKGSREKVKEVFFKWATQYGRQTLIEKNVSAHFITLEDLKKGHNWEEVRFSSPGR